MQPGDLLDGRFDLLDRAGEGGMGEVFRARDRSTDSLVAVKLLRPGLSLHEARLVREARALAELGHPGVVRYVDQGHDPSGAPYLVMEWLEGEDLAARIERGPLAIEEAVAVTARIAAALGAVHARGVIHRDLKPSNVFLAGGDLAQPRLIDFGLARLSEATHITQTGTLMGTPAYMAPEQARGDLDIDARADVHALGCVLYECLTGVRAFTGAHPMAVLAKVLLADVPPPSALRPGVPEAIDALCARMLAKAPGDRPRDGAAVVAAIEALGLPPPSRAAGSGDARAQDAAALTAAARRVLTLVLVAPPAARLPGAIGDDAAIWTAMTPLALREALADAIGARDGELALLADGSILVTLAGGVATDQAARASRCALALREHAPGRAIAVVTGRGELTERLPAAEIIDRAAQMLLQEPPPRPSAPGGAVAPAIAIAIDEVTAGLLDARFDVLDTGASLWLSAERPLVSGARLLMGKPTACVGRDWELSSLEGLLAGCVEESQARAVLVTAPAGLGKSRVAAELLRRIQQRGGPPAVWIARGDPLRAGASLGLLAQAVQGACGLRVGEPIEAQRQRLLAHVEALGAAGEARRIAEFLGEIVAVPFPEEESVQLRAARRDAQLMGDQTRRAWVDFLDAATAAQPLLLLLEDLHWADRPTIAYVDEALRRLPERPWMVLGLARPEVHEAFPGLWAERQPQEIRMKPLSPRACARLVRQVLGEQVGAETVERLVAQADGNAFFLEELIRAAAAGKGDAPPETVLAMVQSRLEMLDEPSRRALRAASVFGQTFWQGAVRALLGEALGERELEALLAQLERQEWLVSRSGSKFEGERELAFRHALVREAAYGMLTDDDRALGHRLAGAWLERAGEPSAAVIADHYDRGGDAPRAVEAYRRAAAQALAANDFGAVLERTGRALALDARGDARGKLLLLRAEAHSWRGEPAETGRHARLAMEVLPRGSDPWYAAGRWACAASCRLIQHDQLAGLADELSEAWRGHEVGSLAVASMASASGSLVIAGLHERAERMSAQAEGVSERFREDPIVSAAIVSARSLQELFLGRLGASHTLTKQAIWHVERAGYRRNACLLRINLGFRTCRLGLYAEAAELLRAALADAEGVGGRLVAFALHNLGLALKGLGAFEEARAAEAKSVALLAAQGERRLEAVSRIYLATILRCEGDLDAAEAEARRAIDLLGEQSPLQAQARATLGEVLLARGRAAEALSEARSAMAVLEAQGTLEEGEALCRLVHAEALSAVGDNDAARAAIAEARTRLLAAAARIDDRAMRDSFLRNVPENARTLALARAWLGEESG